MSMVILFLVTQNTNETVQFQLTTYSHPCDSKTIYLCLQIGQMAIFDPLFFLLR